MCIRYALRNTDRKAISQRFLLEPIEKPLFSREKITLTNLSPVVFNDSPNALGEAYWGITSPWAGKGSLGHELLFNARSETVDSKPVFRKLFENNRCLMIADSFYEWKKPEKKPYEIMLATHELFAFAGIYSEVEKDGARIRQCCMLTTAPNELVSSIHDRMPVILMPGDEKKYLSSSREAKDLLKPYPSDLMRVEEVVKTIRKPAEGLGEWM